ncbi:MAG: hypothetical protein ABSH20_31395, partial [Tepidisphaeraceae bacterium]
MPAPPFFTLLYAGIEQTLAAWGISDDIEREISNKGRDTVTLRTVESFDAPGAPKFAYLTPATIYQGRVLNAGAWTGGGVWMRGYWDDGRQLIDGGQQSIQYQLHSPWWLLEMETFQQYRNEFGGWLDPSNPSAGSKLIPVILPEVFLGETLQEVWQTTGATIIEVVDWLNETWNPTKQGSPPGPGRNDGLDVL